MAVINTNTQTETETITTFKCRLCQFYNSDGWEVKKHVFETHFKPKFTEFCEKWKTSITDTTQLTFDAHFMETLGDFLFKENDKWLPNHWYHLIIEYLVLERVCPKLNERSKIERLRPLDFYVVQVDKGKSILEQYGNNFTCGLSKVINTSQKKKQKA